MGKIQSQSVGNALGLGDMHVPDECPMEERTALKTDISANCISTVRKESKVVNGPSNLTPITFYQGYHQIVKIAC